jgi:hypothetical protein
MHMMSLSVPPNTFSAAASIPLHMACWTCAAVGDVIWS